MSEINSSMSDFEHLKFLVKNLANVEVVEKAPPNCILVPIVTSLPYKVNLFIPINPESFGELDARYKDLEKELDILIQSQEKTRTLLNNSNFTSKAKAEVIMKEKNKLISLDREIDSTVQAMSDLLPQLSEIMCATGSDMLRSIEEIEISSFLTMIFGDEAPPSFYPCDLGMYKNTPLHRS